MVVTSANVRQLGKDTFQNRNVDDAKKKEAAAQEKPVADPELVDESVIGDEASRNLPKDGLSDLERVRRGLAKRALEEDGVVDGFQREEAENSVVDTSGSDVDGVSNEDAKKGSSKSSKKGS